jgi:hypothetical protein
MEQTDDLNTTTILNSSVEDIYANQSGEGFS